MNRSDILKKCVDRGVAGETEVGAVSHLFYVYLLSALQRGQRVEVPNFGTFGTRVAGVKRTRKIPYFEPEQELARKVNQRFENLRSLVTGKYVVTPQSGDTEYKGPQPPYDPTVERGKEYIFDTSREVPLDDYERAAASGTNESQLDEEHVMPRLNLQDEEEGVGIPPEREEGPITPPPTLRDVGPDGGRKAPWLAIVVALLVLAAAVVSLNYFHVIHLWGKKVPKVVEQIPEPPPAEPTAPSGEQATTPPATTGQEETPLPSVAPGKGTEAEAQPPATSPQEEEHDFCRSRRSCSHDTVRIGTLYGAGVILEEQGKGNPRGSGTQFCRIRRVRDGRHCEWRIMAPGASGTFRFNERGKGSDRENAGDRS